jgi:hypothetical protein
MDVYAPYSYPISRKRESAFQPNHAVSMVRRFCAAISPLSESSTVVILERSNPCVGGISILHCTLKASCVKIFRPGCDSS